MIVILTATTNMIVIFTSIVTAITISIIALLRSEDLLSGLLNPRHINSSWISGL